MVVRLTSASARAVIASVVAVMLALSPAYLTGALGLQIRAELGLSAAELGVAIGAFFAATALLSPLLGSAADRIGTVRSLRLALALLVGSCLTVLGFVRSLSTLVVALVMGGIANGLVGPATSRLVAHHVRGRRSLAFGLRQAAVPLSTLLAGVAVPVVGLALGWRAAYSGVALITLPLILVARSSVVADDGGLNRRGGAVSDVRGLILVALAFLLATSAGTALMAFLVDLSVERGLTEAAGGAVLAGVSASGIVVRVAVGWFADRPGVDAFVVMQRQVMVGIAGFLLLVLPTGGIGLMVGATMAIAGGWGWTGLMAHAVAQGNPDAPARSAGIVQTGGAAGGVVGPPLAGLLIDRTAHAGAWGASLLLLILAFVAVSAARRTELADRFRLAQSDSEVGR